MHRVRIVPRQKLEKSNTELPTIVADISRDKDSKTECYKCVTGPEIESALKISGPLRFQENARLAIVYKISEPTFEESMGLFLLTLGVYPATKSKIVTVTFTIYDRVTRSSMLTYAYLVNQEQYTTWANLVVVPVADTIGLFGDVAEAASSDEDKIPANTILAKRFFADLANDKRTTSLATLLTSGELIPEEKIIVIPFQGEGGETLAQSVETELLNHSVRIIVRDKKDLKVVLDFQAAENSGLIEKAVSIGQMTGATAALVGDVRKINGNLVVRARLIHLEKAELLKAKEYTQKVNAKDSAEAFRKIAKQIGDDFSISNN